MATQEERITAVEKFTQVAAAHIQETEENTTILLGVIRSQGHDIRDMRNDLSSIHETLNEHTELLQLHTSLLNDALATLQDILDRLPKRSN